MQLLLLEFFGGCTLYLFLLGEPSVDSEEQCCFYMAAAFEIALV